MTRMRYLLPLFLALAPPGAQAQLIRQSANLTLPTELPRATGYATENALGNLSFNDPLDIASPPGVSDKLFVVERSQGIQVVDLNTLTKSTFMNLRSYLRAQGRSLQSNSENGILSLAFHPNYNQNGYFYLFYSLNTGGLHQRVARFQATGRPGNYNAATRADPSTEAPLITQRDQAGNHNGGDMEFGPDGYLYISTGDEGGGGDAYDNSRHIAKDFFGGILRIDVDSKPGSIAPQPHDESSTGTAGDSAITPGSYRIPPDNPFVALSQGSGATVTYNGFTVQRNKIRTEWYAIGLRNPWRMSIDPETGRIFTADVGQGAYEEIDLITPGFNGGWSWREGDHAYASGPGPSPPARYRADDPIYEYDRTNNGTSNDSVIFGTSVTGGVVYRGDRLPELFGKYLFCDYNSGYIAALTEQADGTWTGERLGRDTRVASWGYDPRNGDALLCDLSSGQIERLRRTGVQGNAPPATLSETGAFSDLGTLAPAPGLVAYEPNVAFWSDYAVKSRWFAVRNAVDVVQFDPAGSWGLPSGMVWVKHFDFETTRGDPSTRRRLETRFLVKTGEDVYGLTYKWREDQSDADLVAEEGLSEIIPGSAPLQTWHYPSRSDCRSCHTEAGGFALGFNTRQMNKENRYGAQSLNQIVALRSAGYLDGPTADPATLPALAPADANEVSVEWRVRSYLEANCSQCHQPGAPAPGHFDARASTPTDLASLINGILVNDLGDEANRFLVPGDAAHSVVLKRLQGTGSLRMPPLSSNEVDPQAVDLLTQWINLSPARQSFPSFQELHFGSKVSPEAQPLADPDQDGLGNRLEYLLGSNPLRPDAAMGPEVSYQSGSFSLSFEQPANRAVLIETSTDLVDWTRWQEPENLITFPATTQIRYFEGSVENPRRFFRVQFQAP